MTGLRKEGRGTSSARSDDFEPRQAPNDQGGVAEAVERLEDWCRFGGPNDVRQWPEIAADIQTVLAAHVAAITALTEIRDLKERPFEAFPADWGEQVNACAECQRYANHPIQRGICNTHRRPLWDREKHDAHERSALGSRMWLIASDALSKAVMR